jgi:diguanylate cyclase (GGDEF)-like protein
MSLQTLPIVLGVVALICFCVSAALYYALKKAQPLTVWMKGFFGSREKRAAVSASQEIEGVLQSKRRETSAAPASALLKILEKHMEEGDGHLPAPGRPCLPPPPTASRRVAEALKKIAASEEGQGASRGSALESVIVNMYEEYLVEIASFQKQLAEATSVGEILGKTCRAVSGFSRKARVVYLSYQAQQRALMVTSRSGTEVFAGTQPKMLLPTQALGKSVAAEELRALFASLDKDSELQRLLKDSCLVETRARGQNVDEDAAWVAQTAWRIYPFYVRGIPQGIFAIQESSVCQRREYNNLVEIFLAQAASAVENIRLHSKIVDVAAKDSVTGLQSRKIFQERLEENFLIARRLRHPLTVVRLDIDHMPAYVKQYGRAVTEAILRHVTRHLERQFRKSDVVARYGQEGFAVLMPHTAFVDAIKKVEEVLQAVRDSSLKLGRQATSIEIKVSVSCGISEFPSHADNPADLLKLVNEACHRGQRAARGSVTLAKVPTGYVPPFNSRFVRSAPKALAESAETQSSET